MTTELAERRNRRALTLAVLAAALAATAAVTVGVDIRASQPSIAVGLVLPDFTERASTAQRITVTSADARYQIERVQRGETPVWVMRDRGDYPVSAGPLARFTTGLNDLEYTRRMTNDPSKHDRLGVGDPEQGGRGVRVQIEDAQQAFLVDLIFGVEADGGLYVRRPNEDQVWAVRGELPPLRDASTWLDLEVLQVEPERLARVEINPAEGGGYVLARDTPDGDFELAAPRNANVAPYRIAAIATRVTRLAPIDVQIAPAVQGPNLARVRAHTFDGLIIDAELVESDGESWVKLVVRAEAEAQEHAALEINGRVSQWAFKLRQADAAAMAPSLADISGGG